LVGGEKIGGKKVQGPLGKTKVKLLVRRKSKSEGVLKLPQEGGERRKRQPGGVANSRLGREKKKPDSQSAGKSVEN